MRILAVLWTVCLVRLCYCGSDLQPQNSPEATGQESTEAVKPLSPFLTKVDGSLFDVEEAEEYAVKVLKLKAKNGVTAKKVKYNGKDIWSARAVVGSPCSSAVLYMDGEKPTLAVLETKGLLGKEGTVYKYHDGKKWKTGSEDDHKKRRAALKKYKHALPATLDLVTPDSKKIDVYTETESEVSFQEFSPKRAFHISSVVDSGATLWEASGAGQKCKLVESYAKDGVELLYLETSESTGTKSKYFEKTGGVWKNISEKEFNEKAKALIGESGKNASLNISHPSRILCQSFDYTFDGNAVQLIVPKRGVTVTKLVVGTEEVYTLSSGETFEYAKAYLNKDGRPELVLVTLDNSSGDSKKAYSRSECGKWVACTNSDAKKKSLRDPADYISDFELDLALANSTDECSSFEVDLLGVTTKYFYPKPGYLAKEIRDGEKKLWKSVKATSDTVLVGRKSDGCDHCCSCLIYGKGDKEVLEMTLIVPPTRRWYYFEKLVEHGVKSLEMYF
ncbi:104 kDa microneme-rhoptry antigen precursor, putative [Theileria equi strain WA]|uniref:104 kDa microneme-rhoptry antigen, putative n=1 Tax=Theileria equi strain WA TaxID=1537102 RepID=L1LCA1_THEEQ|nr:104 kDa microneme-rhoptry antigen precursor, putative [Theileria equi strain WA]EKX73077.1 104 kDa microneme-rhoptry antigen precursor, putative [Theileria equi strain WA]|eukprot:XP_004832529.1 104 kDa microneme-rhoptry antigen precursor, putative [Theileria equi strain WA]